MSPWSAYSITILPKNYHRTMLFNLPETLAGLINESFVVGNDAGVLDTGQDANFIQRILFFLV